MIPAEKNSIVIMKWKPYSGYSHDGEELIT